MPPFFSALMTTMHSETVSILSDSVLVRELGESLKELDAGQYHDEDDVRAAMRPTGRAK